LVGGIYYSIRERITEVASTQATMMAKTKPYGMIWQFIDLVSIKLILGTASSDPEISSIT